MPRGRRKKDSDAEQKSMREGWSRVCIAISAASGLSPPRLEKFFGVGRGKGRSWNNWLSGEQLGDVINRRTIISKASEEGWLNTLTEDELKEFAKLRIINIADFVRGEIRRDEEEVYDQLKSILIRGKVSADQISRQLTKARNDLFLGSHEVFKKDDCSGG